MQRLFITPKCVWLGLIGLLAASISPAPAQTETHTNLQSVTATGTSAWSGSFPFTIRGVILNNPEDVLDYSYDSDAVASNRMGGQWQVFIQATDAGDHGGTALWMGQNYSSIGPWIPEGNYYDETQWSNEMQRVNFDYGTAHHFRAGDLVEVTANQSLFYGGKRNINENHRTNSANDFLIELVQEGYGLPDPESITLANLVTTGTNQIFDQTRQTGGEYYQAVRVRIENLRLTTNYFGTNGWSQIDWSNRRCTVTDGEGRYFTLRMPLDDMGPQPVDWFSAVGIINQESGSGSDGTYGYELFVQDIGPTVRAVSTGDGTLMYWSGTYTNYVLEYSTNLSESTWTQVENAPVKWLAVEDPAGEGSRYYRLRQR